MMARVAGALLAIYLSAAAANLGAGERGLGALALRIENRLGYHMHGAYIYLSAEYVLVEIVGADVLALHIYYVNTRHYCVLLPVKIRP